jgi:hypothetical protein
MSLKERGILNLFRLLIDGMDVDAELFRKNIWITLSPALEKELKHVFLWDLESYPGITLSERLRFIKSFDWIFSPRELAIYLDVESLEATYPSLDDDLKCELLRVVLNQWGFHSNIAGGVESWEHAFGALFAAGAEFEVLCSRKTVEVLTSQNQRIQEMKQCPN